MTIHPLIKIERLTYKATGGKGDRPENTWAAFKFALENGITTLELDTVMTADQTIIIHHDTVLNPKICQYSGGQDLKPAPILCDKLCGNQRTRLRNSSIRQVSRTKISRRNPVTDIRAIFYLDRSMAKANNNPTLLFNIEIKLDIEPKPDPKLIRKNTEAFIKVVKDANPGSEYNDSKLCARGLIGS